MITPEQGLFGQLFASSAEDIHLAAFADYAPKILPGIFSSFRVEYLEFGDLGWSSEHTLHLHVYPHDEAIWCCLNPSTVFHGLTACDRKLCKAEVDALHTKIVD